MGSEAQFSDMCKMGAVGSWCPQGAAGRALLREGGWAGAVLCTLRLSLKGKNVELIKS